MRSPLLLAAPLVLAACATVDGGVAPPPVAAYRGEVEVFLEPNDAQGVCSVTVGLRNASGVRQGEARLELSWSVREGSRPAGQALHMDPLDAGQYDAKNLVLPVKCARVERVAVGSALWRLGWERDSSTIVPIAGVADTEWTFRWDADSGLFMTRPGA